MLAGALRLDFAFDGCDRISRVGMESPNMPSVRLAGQGIVRLSGLACLRDASRFFSSVGVRATDFCPASPNPPSCLRSGGGDSLASWKRTADEGSTGERFVSIAGLSGCFAMWKGAWRNPRPMVDMVAALLAPVDDVAWLSPGGQGGVPTFSMGQTGGPRDKARVSCFSG